jgi:hypothetical protein
MERAHRADADASRAQSSTRRKEAQATVFNEIRVLVSKELDSRQLLCVVLAGDARLPERFCAPELMPLGSRIRRRLVLEYASRDELAARLDHLLEIAGNSALMTQGLKDTLVDHAAGNYRALMNLGDELLAVARDRAPGREALLRGLRTCREAQASAEEEARVRRPDPRQLSRARELAELVILDATLQVLADVLAYEHPCIDDLAPDDPPSIFAARRLNHAARALRVELRRYRASVLARDDGSQTERPL